MRQLSTVFRISLLSWELLSHQTARKRPWCLMTCQTDLSHCDKYLRLTARKVYLLHCSRNIYPQLAGSIAGSEVRRRALWQLSMVEEAERGRGKYLMVSRKQRKGKEREADKMCRLLPPTRPGS